MKEKLGTKTASRKQEPKEIPDLRDQLLVSIGSKITWLREMKGWSQTELGDKIGVTRQTIVNYETQVGWEYTAGTLRKIAEACGMHASYFFYDNIFPDEYIFYSEDFRLIVLELAKVSDARQQLLRETIISLITNFQIIESRETSAKRNSSIAPTTQLPNAYIQEKSLYKINELIKSKTQ